MKKELTFRHRLICALPYSLIHFLINHGCFELFVRNACNKKALGNDMSFLTKLEKKEISPINIIASAFVWTDTPEGDNFWFRKNVWYKDYYEEINNR